MFRVERDGRLGLVERGAAVMTDGGHSGFYTRKAFAEIGYKGFATVELPRGDEKYLRDVSNRVDMILNGE